MKVIAVFAALFVASVMGSGLYENQLIKQERFGHALFREGGALAAPVAPYYRNYIHPTTYDFEGQYYPQTYDGTYRYAPLEGYSLRQYGGPYDFKSEAITTDLRYNLPYGYARHGYLY